MWGLRRQHRDRPISSIVPEVVLRRRWEAVARRIIDESQKFVATSSEKLELLARQCRCKVRLTELDERVVVDVFALVREIAGRVHGIRHHPVQIVGALAMLHGLIAEMRTGEGKTLTSLMTVTFLALKGRGCHVFTANDYLAQRDYEFAKPVLDWFGLTSGVIHADELGQPRTNCYAADVTYGSEKEFAFDFLRDRLNGIQRLQDADCFANGPVEQKIQNQHAYAVIDEADSILIDQATTPMIISYPQPPSAEDLELFHWCDSFAGELTAATDYAVDPRRQSARMSLRGCQKFRLARKPVHVSRQPVESMFNQIERALAAHHFFRENQEYLVIDGRVEIIDQGTGRVLTGRKWRDGLQQAIEIHAGLKPSDATGSAARVTLQTYLKNYQRLCGMTGTATEVRSELHRTFGLRVMSISSHHPSRLRCLPTRVFVNNVQKWSALVADLEQLLDSGRAALIGTSSIAASEGLAEILRARGIDVQVLHAKHHRDEAEIIRMAGQPRRVTVATNMAGRGTDIKLHPAVREAGGLHVILSEMNRSARIDRQLAGRAGRQGDPGSFQTFVSLDDELLTTLGAERIRQLQDLARNSHSVELNGRWVSHFTRAQRLFERRAEQDRRQLLLREQQQRDTIAPLGLDPYVELQSEE